MDLTLAERVKWDREKAGLSQQQLADLVGVNRVAVTNWDRQAFGW